MRHADANVGVMQDAVTIDAGAQTFGAGVLQALIAALRRSSPGDLIRVTGTNPGLGGDLDRWCRFTRNTVVSATETGGRTTWTMRCGELPQGFTVKRPVGSRLWLYTNFDCNLHCDYCCVRSSRAARRALGLDRVRRITSEASALRVGEFFVTGGEPFLLPDIAAIIAACATSAPTTVLTNGMLFAGRKLEALRSLSPLGVTLQISLDSPTPALHDAHRGGGTWLRAWRVVQTARAEGFRVRIAATVSSEEEAAAFDAFLDERDVAPEDRVIRRIALRAQRRSECHSPAPISSRKSPSLPKGSTGIQSGPMSRFLRHCEDLSPSGGIRRSRAGVRRGAQAQRAARRNFQLRLAG